MIMAEIKKFSLIRALSWLMLTVLTSAGLFSFFLQQQHSDKEAEFRILYREVAVRLAQNDAIMPLLPGNPRPAVQRIFPQVVGWRNEPSSEQSITLETAGRYWLHSARVSLLVDLSVLMKDLPEGNPFSQIELSWHNTPIYQIDNMHRTSFWQWSKALPGRSQPFIISAGANPDWQRFPWWAALFPPVLWALALCGISHYRRTQRRRDIADLRAHHAELTRLNTLGELTAGIMHELNQPLTAVLSYNQAAQRLLKNHEDEAARVMLDAAVVQIKRVDTLLKQFRQRLTSDKADYQLIDLHTVWTRVVMLLENEIERYHATINSDIAANVPQLFAPPVWLEQILHNILSNALQAQSSAEQQGGWVELQATRHGEGVNIIITDNGPGLSEEALESVFMPFFTQKKEGVGLGMALVETLVHRLQGSITITNAAGSGARVTLWLPCDSQEKRNEHYSTSSG
ncbi:MAG: Sensor protein ZraS [Candidatus Erwinia impunctatus]|nr:Sensor protein ZraS [Culicoides impunctatus]